LCFIGKARIAITKLKSTLQENHLYYLSIFASLDLLPEEPPFKLHISLVIWHSVHILWLRAQEQRAWLFDLKDKRFGLHEISGKILSGFSPAVIQTVFEENTFYKINLLLQVFYAKSR